MSAFTAAKSAVESLMRSMANEFSGDGLRFNSLVLASLQTAKVYASKPHGDFDNFIPPMQLVPIVRFLLSDASGLVNGNAINVFKHSDAFYHTGYFERVAR
jgi:NAD(P)-dependent dehydrogenase (short-subunit alcohol dehydrogenase family)